MGWEWEGKGNSDFGEKSFKLIQFHQQSKPKLYVQLPVTLYWLESFLDCDIDIIKTTGQSF